MSRTFCRSVLAGMLGIALFSSGVTPGLADSPDASDSSSQAAAGHTVPRPPLRSRAELDAWLKANAGKPTPFDAFSAGGRERVLAGLEFSSDGLGSIPFDELRWQLDRSQAEQLLELFGREAWAGMLDYHQIPARWKGSATKTSDMDHRYQASLADDAATYDADELQYQRNVSASYRKHFPSALFARADGLSDPDLLLLARATASAVRFTSAQPETDDLLVLLPMLRQRGLDITPLAKVAQQSLMATAQLERAHALASRYPSVRFDAIPLVTTAPERLPAGPKWWRLSPDGTSMEAQSADLSGTHLFVMAGCHFSIDAAEDIGNDAELKPVFATQARWLGEPPGREDIANWRDWNDRFPGMPMHLLTRRQDWPMFPTWSMPNYVVVRDGKVIDQTSGSWRGMPENRIALIEMLRRHGLMPPAGAKH